MSMEFLPRLFDSFSRERIPCEKRKNKRHHISIGVACVRFQALSVLSALAGRLFIPYPLGGMDRMGLLIGVAAEDNRYLSTGCGAVRHERSRGNAGYQTVAVRPAHCFSSPRLDRSRVCVAIECCAALRRMTAIGIVAVQDGRQLLTGD